MSRTRTRTALVIAISVAALAAAGTITAVVMTSEPDTDPNLDKVTSLCRDAAVDHPTMTAEGGNSFTVDGLTHDTEAGSTFYRATGTAATGDGYGGTRTYTFDCRTKLTGKRWELLNITMI